MAPKNQGVTAHDIVPFRRKNQECLIIDSDVPGDQFIIMKERKKVIYYEDLRSEIAKI